MDTHREDSDIFSAIESLQEAIAVGYKKGADSGYFGDAKKSFVTLIKRLKKDMPSSQMGASFKAIQKLYDKLIEDERRVALEAFRRHGGSTNDFEMRPAELDIEFQAISKALQGRLTAWHKARQEARRNALAKRKALLNKLRAIVDSNATQVDFAAFESIQNEWKKTNDSLDLQSNTLRANYHALVDRFYNQRSIYFELKELDRKKNLEKKTALCERAEKLLDTDNTKSAMDQLNAIHNEFKSIGPVPEKDREAVWSRLKAASDKLRAQWDAYLKVFRKTLDESREIKEKLASEIVYFEGFSSDYPVEWHKKTQDIKVLKQKWEQAGAVPRQVTSQLNKNFWSAYKRFFRDRKKFFNKLNEERTTNLKKKEELLQQAVELKNSVDWEHTAEVFKQLQRAWKTVGPVPEQYTYKIADSFRSASDFFFVRQRKQLEEQRAACIENFDKKMMACEEIEKISAKEPVSLAQLTDWVERYNAIGAVPNDKADTLEARFNRVVDMLFEMLADMDEEKKNLKLFEIKLLGLKDDPKREQKFRHTGQAVRKEIRKRERDMSVFQNNLDFFGHSKGAEKMKKECAKRLETALAGVETLREKLKLLESVL